MKSPDILLAEDNSNDVRLTLAALEPYRLNITVVRDGCAALDFLFAFGPFACRRTATVPKLILLDLKLPKFNGLEVIERLKSDPRTRCIPIIVLTNSSEERDISATYRAGVNSYLIKPVDFEYFSICVQTLVRWWLQLNHLPDTTPANGIPSNLSDSRPA